MRATFLADANFDLIILAAAKRREAAFDSRIWLKGMWGSYKGSSMKSIQIELPDKLAEAVDMMVQQGWFHSEAEVFRFALLELLRQQHLALHEQFQRDDIAWALRQKDAVE